VKIYCWKSAVGGRYVPSVPQQDANDYEDQKTLDQTEELTPGCRDHVGSTGDHTEDVTPGC